MKCVICFSFLLIGAAGLRLQKQTDQPEVDFGRNPTAPIDFDREATDFNLDEFGKTFEEFTKWKEVEDHVEEGHHVEDEQYIRPFNDYPRCIAKAISPMTAPEGLDTSKQVLAGKGKSHEKDMVSRVFFDDSKIADFMGAVDHLYVICMLCERVFPAALLEKSSYVNGAKSDGCLKTYGGHWRGATDSHKLAVADAKVKGYKSIAIIEEDALFTTKPNALDLESIKNHIKKDKNWQIVRLGWWNHGEAAHFQKKPQRCEKNCKCTAASSASMCAASGPCDLHSSVGYMLSESTYDKIFGAGGAVDGKVINQFQPMVLTPALIHQPVYHQREVQGEGQFMKHCMAQ